MEIRKSPVKWQLVFAVGLIIVGVALRLLPHIPNVAPVGAIALFSGVVLGWRLAVWLPLLVMVVSDLVLGFYPGIVFTWAVFLIITLYGGMLRRVSLPAMVLIGSLGSSVLFFAVSNFGVWVSSGMYAPTFEGLVQCYVMGLPFLRATLLGDLVYSVILFGVYEVVLYLAVVRLRRTTASL